MTNRYKYCLTACLLCACFAAAGVARAQGLGITAGLNFNELSDIEINDQETTFDNAQGWHVAIWYDLPLGPLAIRPGIRYMDAGELYGEVEDGIDLGDVEQFRDFDVSLIEIPIDVRIRLGFPILTPYVLAGPVLRFPTSSEENDDDRLESFSFAGGLGAGVEVNLAGIRLFPEIKYTFGISRFTKEEFSVGGVDFRPDEDQQLNTVMLSLGIGL